MVNCKRFEGKVALVTAATAGIGLGIAQRLGEEGAKVVICSRKQNNVDDTLKALKEKGIECTGCVCHVGNRQHLQKFVQLAIDTYGQIDVLVSNAAVNPASGPLLSIPESAIDKTLEINIKAAIMLVKETAPHLTRGASIVFISSYTAFHPSQPLAIYAVSKTAVVGLTKALSDELGPKGIRVNCVAPGIVPTKFASALVENPELREQQRTANALKRLGTPQDMAAAVAYLSSDDASYVTGESLVVAGGLQSRL
ncbi:MAG: dehydrogenase reductase SDR family member 4-like [Trebouxia sp. A1-2]|nr:MAG: dehydrogenase reductase SDR family member 4-like [Trebouxia sp. A1-2]